MIELETLVITLVTIGGVLCFVLLLALIVQIVLDIRRELRRK